MQNTVPATRPRYRERLAPSLWLLVSAAVLAPMVALTLVPLDSALGLVIGIVVAIAVIGLMVAASPVVSVRDGVLTAGRAHIDARWLGDPVALTGDEARQARGPGLTASGWHLIRGGIDGMVIVPNTDPDDPVTQWSISTRTPDRLAAAIRRARV
ncbi:DUF3093 domain-containing protein [Microbacterium sp. M28]|uniref:DUF3093 domain-containing protein n=1 Tax=Microbacterium sp. M28 TaxID=2962064 RepID=UPI0021F3F70D|nr:DUF3093 domain-containing protein [Microbacterium sp. M28]UYO98570.1 DUF3093 domain-containing protein [Microbacterium sp. M28]